MPTSDSRLPSPAEPFPGLSPWKRAASRGKQALNVLAKAYLEVCVPNRAARRRRKGAFARWYLGKYVRQVCAEGARPPQSARPGGRTIWQYWEQGEAAVPPLVRACLDSVAAFADGRPRVLLTAKNLADHVEIPGFIYDLKARGRMQTAHFSDILRTCLLLQHGGTWMDATIYQTGPLPSAIEAADLFVFQNDPRTDGDGLNMASYFIHARPGEPILDDTRAVIEAYWKDNDFLMNYFLFLHAFTAVTGATPENRARWARVPFLSFLPVQRLQGELGAPFDAARWAELCAATPVHKLTHKARLIAHKNLGAQAETFYDFILRAHHA